MVGGHGHVRPRPDGVRARCGGPGICTVCAAELAWVTQEQAAKAQEDKPKRDTCGWCDCPLGVDPSCDCHCHRDGLLRLFAENLEKMRCDLLETADQVQVLIDKLSALR